jgi:DNA-binding Lrp family transcriptional regulator
MNLNSIFTKSAKGMMELNSRSSRLPRDLLKVLKLVDGKSTVRQLADSAGANPAGLLATMEKLEKDGFVKEFAPGAVPAAPAASPAAGAAPGAQPSGEDDEGESLDFTVILKRPVVPEPPDTKAEDERRRKDDAQRRAKEEAEARAREEAQRRAREDLERRNRIQAEDGARADAEARAREDAERKAREAREEAERKAREVTEKRARVLAEARKHIETMDAKLAEAQGRREKATAALVKARSEAEGEAKRLAEHRGKADAAGAVPQALAAELGHAGTSAAALAKSLGAALEQAQAQVQALADATRYAESRQKALVAQVEASTEAESRARAIEQRSRGEQEIKEIGQARGTAEANAQALAKKRDEAQAQAKALAEAAAAAKADAERRAKERAAALERVESENRALEATRAQTRSASGALGEAIQRAEAASAAFEEAQRAAASGLAGERRVGALEAAEAAARAWGAALGAVTGQGDTLVKALTDGVGRSKARVAALIAAIATVDDEDQASRLKDALDGAQADVPAMDKELSAARARMQEVAEAKGKAEREAARYAEAVREARAALEQSAAEHREREEREAAARRDAEQARQRAQEEAARAEAARAAGAEPVLPALDDSLLAAGAAAAAEEDNTLSRRARTFMSSVLFMDIVEYSTRPVSEQMSVKQLFNDLVADLIRDIADQDKVVVDTGDGAAVSFLGDPEDAYVAATKLSDALYGATHERYKALQVRIGINLGPLKVVRDMRDQVNLVGDGINDAQRVMAFAQPNQILASRSFYDVVARLSPEYANRFRYLGLRKDKHGRDHQIYEWSTPEAAEFQAMVAAETLPGKGKSDDLSGLAALGIKVDEDLKLFDPSTTQQLPSAAEIEAQLEREAQERARHQEEEEKRRAEEAAQRKREEEERARQEELLAAQAEADRQMWEQAQARPAPPPPPPPPAAVGTAIPGAAGAAHPETHAPRARRRRLPVGKIAAGAVVATIAAAVGLIHVVPLEFARSAAESALTARLGEAVSVSGAQGSLFPPHLTLQGIRVGADGALTAERATLPGISGLMGSVGELKRLRIENVRLSEAGAFRLAKWNAGGSGAALPAETIELRNVSVSLPEVTTPAFDADLIMAAGGKVQRIELRSTDGAITGQVAPAGAGLAIQATAQTWRLPLGAPLTFDNLQLKATATPGRMDVEQFDALLFGGRTVGKGAITWGGGWTLAGEAELAAVNAESLLKAFLGDPPLSGSLRGKLTLRMRGDSLKGLFGAPEVGGDFLLERGALNSVDLSKALRTGAREGSRGQTRFTELAGTLALAQNRYAFTNLKLAAGLLSATGTVDVAPDQILGGRLNVEIASAANPLRGALTVGGTATAPTVRP